jgi:hypothetical protein
MSDDVTANGRTIVHKGDGLVNVAALPDVCKTPTPAGPTPVPYVNTASSGDLADGAKSVKIAGSPVAHEKSKLSPSSGDEPGTLGGVVSGKNRGKMTWGSSSPNVIVEGKAVVRYLDVCNHNGNTHNTIHTEGGTIVVVNYGDDGERCKACGAEPLPNDDHVVLPDNVGSVQAAVDKLIADLTDLKEQAAYMVGVTQCGVCSQKYAAHSGQATMFGAACKRQPSLKYSAGDAASMTNLVAERVKERRRMANAEVRALKKNEQGKRLHAYFRSFTKVLDGGSTRGPGVCAGPRALAIAMADGHVPNAVCEKLYQPVAPRTPTTQENTYNVLSDGKKTSAPRTATFSHGDRVPSCTVCADLIPAMLCAWKGTCK